MKYQLWNIFSAINNAQKSKKSFLIYPRQNDCASILNILWQEGFILGYKISYSNPKTFEIFLKYKNNKPIIDSINLLTKPSLRTYYSVKQLWKINTNTGICILSTSNGMMSLESCKKLRIGGELFVIIK